MKLAHVAGINDLRLIEIDQPVAGPDDVVVRTASVGICGSDLGFLKAGGLAGPSDRPLAIGHELSGTVAQVGGNVTSVAVGDRVAVNPLVNMIGNGGPEGGFADLLLVRDVVAKPHSLVRLPNELSFDEGALIEPLAVAVHCLNRGDAKTGEKVAIFGAGPIGLCTVAALRARGIEDIAVFDPSALRRERARQLGAAATFDPAETAPAEALAGVHGRSLMFGILPVVGTDLFIEASGAKGMVPDIVGYGKHNSRIAIVAIPKEPAPIDFLLLTAKEMSITTSMGYPTEFADAVAILRAKAVDLAPLVSHRFPADAIHAAFTMAQQPDAAAKVLVQYDR